MISLRLLLIMLKIPLDLVIVVLRFYLFGGLRSRKYSRLLINCLRLRVYRAALTTDIMDGKYLMPYSNKVLLHKILPLISPQLVAKLPSYGERFDGLSFWLVKAKDRKSTDPIIIFSHGGGYFLQTTPSQVQSVLTMYHLLDSEKQRNVSILFLDYKLVSEGVPFPYQLHQLDATYSKLVEAGNTNIILMGDSAGGHLSIGYTQYLKTTRLPVYPSKLVLISPWVKLSPLPLDTRPGTSWAANEDFDMIRALRFAHITDLKHIVGFEDPFSLLCLPGGKLPRQRSDWLIPNFSDPSHDVFLILGEDESFRDDIIQWAHYALSLPLGEKYGTYAETCKDKGYEYHRKGVNGEANLTAYVEPLGVHDAVLFFEHDAAKDIVPVLKAGKKPTLHDISAAKYYGMTRIVKFLNEAL